MKLTEWFEPEMKPALPGIYEIEDLPSPYLYWNGSKWLGAWPKLPVQQKELRLAYSAEYAEQSRWRGLAEDPSGRKQ